MPIPLVNSAPVARPRMSAWHLRIMPLAAETSSNLTAGVGGSVAPCPVLGGPFTLSAQKTYIRRQNSRQMEWIGRGSEC
jgi:hypothetical protein